MNAGPEANSKADHETVPFPGLGSAMGPFAIYRGAVLQRMYPSPPNESLPVIQGGGWSCHRTSSTGHFSSRVACIAMCNNPNHLPIDMGVESWWRSGRHALQQGWLQIASPVRIWYSYWLGYPALAPVPAVSNRGRLASVPAMSPLRIKQDPADIRYRVSESGRGSNQEIGPAHPTVPSIRCLSDRGGDWLDRLSQSSSWAEREVSSSAVLKFSLSFDRNSWPPSFETERGAGAGPGLQYP